MKKSQIGLLFLLTVYTLMFCSCDLLNRTLGLDNMKQGDSTVVRGTGNDDQSRENGSGGGEVVLTQEPEIKDIAFFKIGDAVTDESRSGDYPVLSYTITGMQVSDNMASLNIGKEDMPPSFAEETALAADGKLTSETLFVMVDVTISYVSEPKEANPNIDKNDHIISCGIQYKSDEKDGLGFIRNAGGEAYFSNHPISNASSSNYYHYTLAAGETMNCRLGWFVDRERAETLGLMFMVGNNFAEESLAKYIDLPYDYSGVGR